MTQQANNLPAMQETQETWVQSPGWKDPLEEETATHCSILTRRILWTEEPGGLVHGTTNSWTQRGAWVTTINLQGRPTGNKLIFPFHTLDMSLRYLFASSCSDEKSAIIWPCSLTGFQDFLFGIAFQYLIMTGHESLCLYLIWNTLGFLILYTV